MIVGLVRTAVAVAVFLALAAGAVAQHNAQAQESPQAVIEKLGAAMIDTMKNAKQLAYNGRFQKLAPEIVGSFDLPRMVSIAVGGAWKSTTPDQQQRLVDAFARYMVAVHASRLDGYSGETFKVGATEPLQNGLTRVRAQFVKTSGATENIDYVMQNAGGKWQVVDVFYRSAISEVATRRSEYTAVIKDSGVEKLIAKMDEKTAELGHKTSTN
jgi:phospholipid transport system substrate-binding protein